mmetsp:Transcript_48914/g.95618  ORF Transcript_48914/g.95618 Transcript_48914/m.95618 type:complete len:126 (-) Transcript_48914:194-571(-)|eukprot:CAMPEP_0194272552 /NCGR_PEP_ID=MMETSP0169-20130528/6097_1 /TAXON_ID=218684 /ORGANISM="Corethron pennatum, Strain L29A3" /LENGTH=125 /DNA_ID=CAMNT_0039015247 /DNA_START=109 /DNA_END=486 /DNA_ORIENTATION=-
MSAEEVAKAFVAHFYTTFDAPGPGPENLRSLYQPTSMMTFEGQQVQGPEAIISKLKGVGEVKHTITNIDVQPSNSPSAVLIFVIGNVRIGGSANPVHFCEMFQLVSTGPGAYYVHNEVFRLNYGL